MVSFMVSFGIVPLHDGEILSVFFISQEDKYIHIKD